MRMVSIKKFFIVMFVISLAALTVADTVCQAFDVKLSRKTENLGFSKLAILEKSKREPLEDLVPIKPETETPLLFKINYVYHLAGSKEVKTLTSGSVLNSGDYYKIIFTPTETCYVYIFQIDSTNKIYRLFPMKTFKGVTVNNFNPVESGKTYYIPTKDQSFRLDKQTGTEKIYFLASRQRNEILEGLFQENDLQEKLEQIDQLLESAEKTQDIAPVVSDPAETETITWREHGQTFSVLRRHLENLCDGCVYVITFLHQ